MFQLHDLKIAHLPTYPMTKFFAVAR
jgi:hypothetical protein